MFQLYVEVGDCGVGIQCVLDVLCGVFVEYQVVVVGECEGLFVFVFYCGLYWCFQCLFDVVQQIDQVQWCLVVEVYQQVGYVVLCMWCGDDVLFVVELCQYGGVIQCGIFGEIFGELFLDQLV